MFIEINNIVNVLVYIQLIKLIEGVFICKVKYNIIMVLVFYGYSYGYFFFKNMLIFLFVDLC